MNVAVFCSSSNQIEIKYQQLATDIGRLLAEFNDTLVFGGSNVGMMLSCAEEMHKNNGHIIGVIPNLIYDKGHFYNKCDQLIKTSDMHERKEKLTDIADAFLILPGGIGTLDEFFATITLQQLSYIEKPIVLFNYDHYYDEIIQFLKKSIKLNFSRKNLEDLFRVITDVQSLDQAIHTPQHKIEQDKWL